MKSATFPGTDSLCQLVEESFSKVFTTMIHRPAVAKRRYRDNEMHSDSPFYTLGAKDPLIIGSVGFTGETNGVIYQYMQADFGLVLASIMTGLSVSDIRIEGEAQIVDDVIGELTNMVCGTFKNALCDLGFGCKLTLPTVLRGTHMRVKSVESARRFTFLFEVAQQPLVADLFLNDLE